MNKLFPAILLALLLATPAMAQRQMETLGRGVVAVRTSSTTAYVGWRLLGTDPDDTKFNLFRVTSGVTNLVTANVTNSCNFSDTNAATASTHAWFVQPVFNGATQANSGSFSMPANTPTQQYLNLALNKPADGTNASGPFTYNANDCSAADLDGDGEYEIVLKWDPSNSKDNSQSGFTGDVFLDGYKLNGTLLWRINLGPNIRAGAHYTQFMVYDLDGDGRAELACKTAPGSRDGLGNYVDGNAAYTVYTNGSGYILSGPEYFTIFDGLTGAKLASTNYNVPRGTVGNWGDTYGNRVDRFLACVAYLDGVRPSVVMCRGYYTRAALCAWDWRNGQLTQRWLFDTGDSGGPWSGYKGQGAHSLTVGDVDGDGKDEITFGACVIDDNGTGLYTTQLGHGDALHMSDMKPDATGLEVWMVHEDPGSYGANGSEFRNAKTGGLLFGVSGEGVDVGRGVAIDIDPNYPGYEMWGSRGGLMSANGTQLPFTRPGQMNFAAYWDADLNREILDGTTVSKYNPANGAVTSVLSPSGLTSNNSTKSTPCLSVDLFGDWREEIIWRETGNTVLRIYTTTNVATNRLPTLMHDPQYRLAVAWQNVAYNQPPHPGYFIGPNMYAAPLSPVSTAHLAWRGGNGGNVWDAANNWFTNGVWTNNVIASYANGNSVLFDMRASNNTTITLSGTLTPGDIKVHAPTNFTFTGSGDISGAAKLFKAGPGRLTLANTNTFTGGTFVSGGQLIVNGALPASAVVVESRGDPWGRARIGGKGTLGAGLTVQRDCGIIVGPGTNSPGTLTVTNGVTELGGVVNQFDLYNDPSGVTRTNDRIAIIGNLSLTGTNSIEVTLPDGGLGAGVYPLFTYTGTLSGGLANLTLTGDFIQPVSLTNMAGQIALLATIPASPPVAPTALTATSVGAFQINLTWADNSSDENEFLIERATGSPSGFVQIAAVAPNTTNYSNLGLAAGTTYYYRVHATNLAGFSAWSNTNNATTSAAADELTWRGDGTGNLWDVTTTPNWFDGSGLVVFNNNTDVTFDNSGSNNIATSLVGTLQPASVTVNATKNYTFSGAGGLTCPTTLTKAGSASLTLANTGTNTFTGGVIITAGTVTLSAAGALGSSPVNLQSNATLALGTRALTAANPLTVSGTPTVTGGDSGGLSDIRDVSGSGTLKVTVTTGVLDFEGSWAGFNGKVQFSGGNILRFNGSTGSATTEYDFGTNTLSANKRNTASTITLGALGGGLGTSLSGTSGGGTTTTTYSIGAKNLNTTFSGSIVNGGGAVIITKTGTGTQTFGGTNAYTGTTTVSAGTLLVNGNQSAATGAVTVSSNATLGGTGIIGGAVTVSVSGTIAPGTSIGRLTLNSNLTLNALGTARFELTRVPLTNDSLVVAGTAALNGTLQVLNTGVEALEAGDNFKLLTAGATTGSFASLDLPLLDADLGWSTNRFAADGSLWVVSTTAPTISTASHAAGNFILGGNGGTPGWNYFVLSTTNLTEPVALWERLATNQFTAAGAFNFTNNAAPSDRRFFRIQSE